MVQAARRCQQRGITPDRKCTALQALLVPHLHPIAVQLPAHVTTLAAIATAGPPRPRPPAPPQITVMVIQLMNASTCHCNHCNRWQHISQACPLTSSSTSSAFMTLPVLMLLTAILRSTLTLMVQLES